MPLYQVNLPNGITTGLEVTSDGIVISAIPVLKQSVGLQIDRVRQWAEKKGGSVRLVSSQPARRKTGEP